MKRKEMENAFGNLIRRVEALSLAVQAQQVELKVLREAHDNVTGAIIWANGFKEEVPLGTFGLYYPRFPGPPRPKRIAFSAPITAPAVPLFADEFEADFAVNLDEAGED